MRKFVMIHRFQVKDAELHISAPIEVEDISEAVLSFTPRMNHYRTNGQKAYVIELNNYLDGLFK